MNARLFQQQSGDLPPVARHTVSSALFKKGITRALGGRSFAPPCGCASTAAIHGGCDRIAQRSAGQLSHELWTVDVLGVQGLTEHVQTHQGDNHRCTGWDYRLMRCGGLRAAAVGACRPLRRSTCSHRGVGGDAVEQLGRHALHFVLLHDDLTGDDHVTVGFKLGGAVRPSTSLRLP